MGMACSGGDSCKGEAQASVRSGSLLWLFIYRSPVHTIRDGVLILYMALLEEAKLSPHLHPLSITELILSSASRLFKR
jgi:hypothetical protein